MIGIVCLYLITKYHFPQSSNNLVSPSSSFYLYIWSILKPVTYPLFNGLSKPLSSGKKYSFFIVYIYSP